MTTINIPACGWKIGTCGWLAAGLRDGSVTIKPGETKAGTPGLWLRWGDGKSGCLAIFNEYGMSQRDFPRAKSFCVYDGFLAGSEFAGDCPLTPAARDFLRTAAEEWCEAANHARTEDACTDEMPHLIVA